MGKPKEKVNYEKLMETLFSFLPKELFPIDKQILTRVLQELGYNFTSQKINLILITINGVFNLSRDPAVEEFKKKTLKEFLNAIMEDQQPLYSFGKEDPMHRLLESYKRGDYTLQ